MKTNILWGFHPIFQKTPIKLTSDNIKAEKAFRENHGWICAEYKIGDYPHGLMAQANSCPHCGTEWKRCEMDLDDGKTVCGVTLK